MKLLCEECYQELETKEYSNGIYVIPCECKKGEYYKHGASCMLDEVIGEFDSLTEEIDDLSDVHGIDHLTSASIEELKIADEVLMNIYKKLSTIYELEGQVEFE